MKYARTKDSIIDNWALNGIMPEQISPQSFGIETVKYADTIEELIMVDDLIVWYNSISKRNEYSYIHNEDELFYINHYPTGRLFIKQLFIKVGNDFRLVAKANKKGELELL